MALNFYCKNILKSLEVEENIIKIEETIKASFQKGLYQIINQSDF